MSEAIRAFWTLRQILDLAHQGTQEARTSPNDKVKATKDMFDALIEIDKLAGDCIEGLME